MAAAVGLWFPSGAWAWAGSALALYALLCALLRHRQQRAMESAHPFPTRASLASMTHVQAYEIHKWLGEQEFPSVFAGSIFFALFKTYSVPSISQLLAQTGEIGRCGNGRRDVEKTSKRAADTSVLLTNMVVARPESERAVQAVARTRFLHAAHRRAGRISDDDMLYTLSLFTLEPMRWVDEFEWRRLSAAERCAMAAFWKALGEDLDVPYRALPSSQAGGWVDGLHWLEELDTWRREYAARHVVLHESNVALAAATLDIALFELPAALKPAGRHVVSILLGPEVRDAVGLPPPPAYYDTIFRVTVAVRKFVVRHLCLPRPHWLRMRHLLDGPDPHTGRYHVARWIAHPWYARRGRWSPRAWLRWARGRVEEENRFHAEGYKIREVGPARLVGKGGDEMDEIEQSVRASRGACPLGTL
ncbi:hypothetical protein B0T24DRAFT_595631 [Lasiosphaeria ovina]|uniref:ER-bound oxygenase mpaB/mpaB'/Rubber oxygenase catalytic domain-containing protein n=1 Tax=Lasiosphaeria ovina TaxID=92902 RepID=A0AAE0K2C8_9PEZI|nr:hypothetical protein B0T24DRAFT_595631 [Lasiosphaeria ovina]